MVHLTNSSLQKQTSHGDSTSEHRRTHGHSAARDGIGGTKWSLQRTWEQLRKQAKAAGGTIDIAALWARIKDLVLRSLCVCRPGSAR